MEKKSKKIRFSEGDLARSPVREVSGKGISDPGRKTQARARLPSEKETVSAKLKEKKASAEAEGKKLHFSDSVSPADMETAGKRPVLQRTVRTVQTVSSEAVRAEAADQEDDNAGVEAMNEGEGIAERGMQTAASVHYSRKLRARRRSEPVTRGSDQAAQTAAGTTFSGEGQPGLNSAGKNEGSVNPFSRWRQRMEIRKEYIAARARKTGGTAAGNSAAGWRGAVFTGLKGGAEKAGRAAAAAVKDHRHTLFLGGVLVLLLMGLCSLISSCSAMISGTGQALLSASYTAEDDDILGVEADYSALEQALRNRISGIRDEYPGFDEYEMNVSEINHNPHELAALLTVLCENYSREEVRRRLQEIFDLQYEFTVSERTETKTETKKVRVGESLGQVVTSGYCSCPICCGQWSGGPTASGVYPSAQHTLGVDADNPFVPMGTRVIMNGIEYRVEDTGHLAPYGVQFDVYYDSHSEAAAHGHQTWEAYLADDNGSDEIEVTSTETKQILTVTLVNHGIGYVAENIGLTDEQMERYRTLVAAQGNRSELFADDIYANLAEGLKYDIPGEAMSDVRFARMISEAEKYLGYPYVWGGSSPDTSFDCSGFVSWVINNCGNGWNVGRQTAEGLRQLCSIIPSSEAKPGDLIFFQGTYDTPGASHVGIYVGNGMMIHCGNPIQYTTINTDYWQNHFFCFGRLP